VGSLTHFPTRNCWTKIVNILKHWSARLQCKTRREKRSEEKENMWALSPIFQLKTVEQRL
jgi:hypothetical protein